MKQNIGITVLLFVWTFQAHAASSSLVISELRVLGPNGNDDEFVEIKNISASAISIGGYKLRKSNNGSTLIDLATVPAGTSLSAGGYYLFTRARGTSGMAYGGSAAGNQTFLIALGTSDGVAITLSNNTVVDSVAFGSASVFKEGTQIAHAGSGNYSYERKPLGTNNTDTDNNNADFQLNASSSNPQNSTRISGAVFNDLNHNGVQDAGETGLQDVRVFLDADEDNEFDVGEVNELTGAGGAYTFQDVATVQPRVAVDMSTAAGYQLISPTKPLKRRGRYNAGDHLNGDVWAEGDLAAMGSYDGAVLPTEFVDISDPDNPTLRWSWTESAESPAAAAAREPSRVKTLHEGGSSGNEFEDVVIKNQVAFVASNGVLGIHILDVAPVLEEPATEPAILAHIDTANFQGSNQVHTLYVEGNLLCFATNSTPDIYIYDISQFVSGRPLPASPAPVKLKQFTINAGAAGVRVHEVTVRNGRLYVAINESSAEETASGTNIKETEVWDISQVTTAGNPVTFLGHYDSGYATHTVWGAKDDGSLVISAREPYPWQGAVGEVTLWDFSNPASPVKLSTLNALALGLGDVSSHIPFTVNDTTLYMSWYWAGVVVFDISDPANPVLAGRFDTTSSTAEVGSSRVDLQACKLEYSIVSPK